MRGEQWLRSRSCQNSYRFSIETRLSHPSPRRAGGREAAGPGRQVLRGEPAVEAAAQEDEAARRAAMEERLFEAVGDARREEAREALTSIAIRTPTICPGQRWP